MLFIQQHRFRRDPDDAGTVPLLYHSLHHSYLAIPTDAPQRPSFRSTLTQPSQMGNFRHQSIRNTERDRDRDGDKDRDRDKEGQERLRNVRILWSTHNLLTHLFSSFPINMTVIVSL